MSAPRWGNEFVGQVVRPPQGVSWAALVTWSAISAAPRRDTSRPRRLFGVQCPGGAAETQPKLQKAIVAEPGFAGRDVAEAIVSRQSLFSDVLTWSDEDADPSAGGLGMLVGGTRVRL